MKTFYKIENGKLQVGSGSEIPDGFIEYEVNKEPKELLDALAAEKQEKLIAEKKAEIIQQLETLTVTTLNKNVFDANMVARQNMADAILASDTLGITQTTWRMADNTEVLIDISELKEAHALAIKTYAEIKGIGQ